MRINNYTPLIYALGVGLFFPLIVFVSSYFVCCLILMLVWGHKMDAVQNDSSLNLKIVVTCAVATLASSPLWYQYTTDFLISGIYVLMVGQALIFLKDIIARTRGVRNMYEV